MRLIDLARQVQSILPLRFGGTGNEYGYSRAVVVPATNREGSSLAVGSVVRSTTKGTVELAEDTDTVFGVVVGYYDNTLSTIVPAAVANGATAAICTHGPCRVLTDADLDGGDFAFVSASNDGQAYGDPTRDVGAFGVFLQDGDFSQRPLVRVHLWGATDGSSGSGGGSPLTTKGDLYGYNTADARVPVGTNGQVLKSDSGNALGVSWSTHRHAVVCELYAPTGGSQVDFRWPWDGTIVRWTLGADATGSAVVDIWKRSYAANTFPTVANTITASAKPTLSSGSLADSTTLTGWTTGFSRGDMVRINVDSVSGIGRLTLELEVTES